MSSIESKLQSLQAKLDNDAHARMEIPMPTTPRPNLLMGSTLTPTRNRKVLDLPFLQQQHNRLDTETETKFKKIMKKNGIITINGQQYHTKISELVDLDELGNGTSGHVVRMQHKPSNAIIAVKQMRRTGNDEENKRIIMDINVVLKSHDCPYIVQCLGCFITEADVWICMELMSTCFDKLQKRLKCPVPEHILGKVTVATVKALSYLKEKHDVIHRDVKPSNILIDEKGQIKLCDFGISGRLVDSKAKTRSAGCAAYMAPERIDPKKPEYDIRADVWSLGITLVELATGVFPYKGCKTDFEVLTRVLESDPPSLPSDQGFSADFQQFVHKCLTKDHRFRPKYKELLEQPFITYYERTPIDVAAWFRSVADQCGIPITSQQAILPPPAHQSQSSQQLRLSSLIPSLASSYNKQSIAPTHLNESTPQFTNNSRPVPNTPPNNSMSSSTKSHPNSNQPNQKPPPSAAGVTQLPMPTASKLNQQMISSTNSSLLSLSLPKSSTGEKLQQQQQHQPTTDLTMASFLSKSKYEPISRTVVSPPNPVQHLVEGGGGERLNRLVSPPPASSQSYLGRTTMGGRYTTQEQLEQQARELNAINEMNRLHCNSPFMHRRTNDFLDYGSPKKESTLSSIGQNIFRNLTTSPFAQRKKISQAPHNPPDEAGGRRSPFVNNLNSSLNVASNTPSPLALRKRYEPEFREDEYKHLAGNTSPIVLQRFYHQQSQLRDAKPELSTSPPIRQPHQPRCYQKLDNSNPFAQQNASHIPVKYYSPQLSQRTSPAPQTVGHNYESHIPVHQYQKLSGRPVHGGYLNAGGNYGVGAESAYNGIGGRSQQQPTENVPNNGLNNGYGGQLKDEQGWLNSLAGVVKRHLAPYLKSHLASGDGKEKDKQNNLLQQQQQQQQHHLQYQQQLQQQQQDNRRDYRESREREKYGGKSMGVGTVAMQQFHPTNPFAQGAPTVGVSLVQPPAAHTLSSIDRRHRSPDPPPRLNRGQSPLLLRRKLEIAQAGSPNLPRRYATASPPLLPPRRGCESVPGSPQHFRARINYTPEPQRRQIYRQIDQ